MPSAWIEPKTTKRGRVWLVRWEAVNKGVRTRGSMSCGPLKEHAEKFRARKLEELYAGKLGLATSPAVALWQEFAGRYLEHSRKHKSAGTFQNFDKRALDLFTKFYGNADAGRITGDIIGRWETVLMEEFKPNTVRMHLRAVRTALNWGKREGIISTVPRFHFPPADKVGRVLSDEEVGRLLSAIDERYRGAVVFALHTGVRRGELLSLSWDRIRTATDGHREAEIGGIGGYTTKTRQSRVVPLHPRAVESMGTPQEKGRIFSEIGEQISHAVEKAGQSAGLGRVRCHDLRHTWATRFMQATGDLFALMQIGGWRDMGSVKEYQHLTRTRALSVGLVSYNSPDNLPTKKG